MEKKKNFFFENRMQKLAIWHLVTKTNELDTRDNRGQIGHLLSS